MALIDSLHELFGIFKGFVVLWFLRWSGAGVGVGTLRGVVVFLEICKIQKLDYPKIPRFHAH